MYINIKYNICNTIFGKDQGNLTSKCAVWYLKKILTIKKKTKKSSQEGNKNKNMKKMRYSKTIP